MRPGEPLVLSVGAGAFTAKYGWTTADAEVEERSVLHAFHTDAGCNYSEIRCPALDDPDLIYFAFATEGTGPAAAITLVRFITKFDAVHLNAQMQHRMVVAHRNASPFSASIVPRKLYPWLRERGVVDMVHDQNPHWTRGSVYVEAVPSC